MYLVRFSSYCTFTVVSLCCFSPLMCLRAGYGLCSSVVSMSYPTVILSNSDLHNNNSAVYLIMPFPGPFPTIQKTYQSLSQRFTNYKAKRRDFESSCHTAHAVFSEKHKTQMRYFLVMESLWHLTVCVYVCVYISLSLYLSI